MVPTTNSNSGQWQREELLTRIRQWKLTTDTKESDTDSVSVCSVRIAGNTSVLISMLESDVTIRKRDRSLHDISSSHGKSFCSAASNCFTFGVPSYAIRAQSPFPDTDRHAVMT